MFSSSHTILFEMYHVNVYDKCDKLYEFQLCNRTINEVKLHILFEFRANEEFSNEIVHYNWIDTFTTAPL